MHFETHFMLDREHYAECFDQSMIVKGPQKPRIAFMVGLSLAGIFFLFFTNVQGLLAWFFFGIAILEFFSYKYRRAWWLTRQMMSKNAGNKITLIFDENGIENKSLYINNLLAWPSIKSFHETPAGYMLNLQQGGQQYITKSCLDSQLQAYIQQKLSNKKIENELTKN
ncbi:YcxB family protein [Psychromonas sp. RZ22]|uniref:YcxB family protein n=1 Tax=Psychromonas algarum TaxID=2555643 RepID=UPI001067EB60|nr:YcxB family protein [Psychromonas sp. RZ22]TEW54414.1 YcxB family protein [Psychromonas sp. RZ22]